MSFEKGVSTLNQTKKKELQQGESSVQKFGAFFYIKV